MTPELPVLPIVAGFPDKYGCGGASIPTEENVDPQVRSRAFAHPVRDSRSCSFLAAGERSRYFDIRERHRDRPSPRPPGRLCQRTLARHRLLFLRTCPAGDCLCPAFLLRFGVDPRHPTRIAGSAYASSEQAVPATSDRLTLSPSLPCRGRETWFVQHVGGKPNRE